MQFYVIYEFVFRMSFLFDKTQVIHEMLSFLIF